MKAQSRVFVAVLMLVLSGVSSSRADKYAGEPFTLGVGARALALGGAVIAGPFDGTAGYWNPAGMNELEGRHVVAMHAETFGSLLNHDFVAYLDSRPREYGTLIQSFGFYLYYLGGGGIKITELDQFNRPYVVREESHGDYLLAASVAGRLSARVDFGLTAKVIYRDLGTESGQGLTLDAGALYRLNQWVDLGLMITDVTTGFIRYSGETFGTGDNSETINPAVRPGIATRYIFRDFTARLSASGDIRFEGIKYAAQYWSGDISLDTHYGLEIDYRGMVFGRAGFDIGRLTAGAGVDIKKITVDFAYLHHDDLNETYRVSAGYRF